MTRIDSPEKINDSPIGISTFAVNSSPFSNISVVKSDAEETYFTYRVVLFLIESCAFTTSTTFAVIPVIEPVKTVPIK